MSDKHILGCSCDCYKDGLKKAKEIVELMIYATMPGTVKRWEEAIALALQQYGDEKVEEIAIFMEEKFAHPFVAQPERKYIAQAIRNLKKHEDRKDWE